MHIRNNGSPAISALMEHQRREYAVAAGPRTDLVAFEREELPASASGTTG
jgi:hypothetical protein